MSYEVKSFRKIGPKLQCIACKEIDSATEHLEKFTPTTVLSHVHTVRKHFKKIRALLRLVHDGIGKAAFDIENACFRDAGRQLRDLRDAQVLVKACDTLRERFFNEKHPALITHARRLLMDHERRCVERLIHAGGPVKEVLIVLRTGRARAEKWDLKDFGWKETRRAIKRSYKQARAAGQKAAGDSSMKKLHEWRKRVKDLWYHARLLRRMCPAFMDQFAQDLETLSEFLGDDHDLAVLRDSLCERRDVLKRPRAMSAFLRMLDLRRSELIRAALDLGPRICEPSPAVFARELDAKRSIRRKTRRKIKKLAARLEGR